jgi:purine nucleoside phosphorylase I, inosine and guanosine-specific
MNLLERIESAKNYIKSKYDGDIDAAIILGTGLGELSETIENGIKIPYMDIPEFPVSTVAGHKGELIIGDLSGKKVVAFNGRFHYYEGYSMETVTFGVRVTKALGIEKIIVTNAAGGMNPSYHAGELMIITDHINLSGDNPLIGKNFNELGPRFPDMSQAYNRELILLAEKAAKDLSIHINKGVYASVAGPNFETPAELRMLRMIGGDAVGMSTVPEVIAANHMGMKVLGISCITDMAVAETLQPVSHEIVLANANRAKNNFLSLVKRIVKEIE